MGPRAEKNKYPYSRKQWHAEHLRTTASINTEVMIVSLENSITICHTKAYSRK